MTTSNILSLGLADLLHRAHLRRLERYSRSDDFRRLLEASKTGAALRRRGGMPMVFEDREYGTEDWLKHWLTSGTSEVTGRILLDAIESDEGEATVGILIIVLSAGGVVLYL